VNATDFQGAAEENSRLAAKANVTQQLTGVLDALLDEVFLATCLQRVWARRLPHQGVTPRELGAMVLLADTEVAVNRIARAYVADVVRRESGAPLAYTADERLADIVEIASMVDGQGRKALAKALHLISAIASGETVRSGPDRVLTPAEVSK
jgi:hypothetical protein